MRESYFDSLFVSTQSKRSQTVTEVDHGAGKLLIWRSFDDALTYGSLRHSRI